jgi:hypothetical protein|tara:strand:+ start:81 stop:413 length:333 start_codon:yes stop_codon:yes gene_type:complete
MTALKKKSETCEEQLRRMCSDIADGITDPDKEYWNDTRKWMEDVYDIEWITFKDHSYKAARLLVAGGGPSIWVNLQTNTVDGYWGGDKVTEPFIDNLGLDEYCEEMYASK